MERTFYIMGQILFIVGAVSIINNSDGYTLVFLGVGIMVSAIGGRMFLVEKKSFSFFQENNKSHADSIKEHNKESLNEKLKAKKIKLSTLIFVSGTMLFAILAIAVFCDKKNVTQNNMRLKIEKTKQNAMQSKTLKKIKLKEQ